MVSLTNSGTWFTKLGMQSRGQTHCLQNKQGMGSNARGCINKLRAPAVVDAKVEAHNVPLLCRTKPRRDALDTVSAVGRLLVGARSRGPATVVMHGSKRPVVAWVACQDVCVCVCVCVCCGQDRITSTLKLLLQTGGWAKRELCTQNKRGAEQDRGGR
jgi:hypothetical protein